VRAALIGKWWWIGGSHHGEGGRRNDGGQKCDEDRGSSVADVDERREKEGSV
jgi:hypothetical protein